MPRVGLKRVVKIVRGKKGTTRRTYWMKSQEQPTKLRQRKDPINNLEHAGQYLGLGVGGKVGTSLVLRHLWKPTHSAPRAFATGAFGGGAGALVGGQIGKYAGRTAARFMSEPTQRRWARRVALAGAAVQAHQFYSLFKSVDKIRNS
jgi:hypothetical protein